MVGNADNNDADADTNAVPENNADFDDDNDFIGDFDDDNDAPDANENTNPYANVPTTAYAPDDNDTFSDNDDNDDDVFPANNAPPRAYPAAAPAFTPPPAPPPPPPPPPPPAPAPPPRAPRATPTRATVAKPDDELLQKARALVFTERQASTPLLQRRLAVSYGQAAELIAALEAHGDIGPDRGPGLPREVLRHSNAHQHPQQHQPHPQPPPHPHQHPQPAAHPQPPSPQPAAHTHAPDADRRSLPQASVTPISTTAFSPTVSVTASAAALVSGAPAQTDLLSQLGLAPEVPTPKHRHAARKRTVLIANVLTGLDEKPYVRGTGPGLNEHIGVPMEPAGIGRWQWVAPDDAHPVRATVWKNDTYPDADGATDILPGEIREITPDFRN
ncbi:MAG: hypothetical protein LBT53_08385 [Puniceicoccales bacterium]|nr:hypothetical protein [Puniceicoccales bacterium]